MKKFEEFTLTKTWLFIVGPALAAWLYLGQDFLNYSWLIIGISSYAIIFILAEIFVPKEDQES